jgi:lambda family phage portal protein
LAYDGARSGRRNDGWVTGNTSANAEIGMATEALRSRARALVRNNPHAAKAVAVIVANKIGTGIMCQADGPNARANKRLDTAWQRWVDDCDVTGRMDLYGIQALAERTRAESGEALIRLHAGRGEVPLRLQVLEPDFIDSTKNERLGTDHEIRLGVEYRNEAPVAYWLYEAHPGDGSLANLRRGQQSNRVSANEIIHYYKPLRPGQSRGVTDFAPVIEALRDLGDYANAELMRKKIAACSVGAVTTPAGLPGASLAPTALDDNGDRVEQFRPGMISYLKPGEGIDFFDPKPSGDYQQFMSVELHAIASGLGIPYELLTGDLSEVTYTSHRGGLVQFRGMVEADQWQIVVPQVCRPIWQAFVSAYRIMDGSVDPRTPAVYTPPRFGLLDPAKEIPAMVAALEAGIESYPNLIAREGYDWREKIAEIKASEDEAKRIGIAPRVGIFGPPEPPKPAPAPKQAAKPEDDDESAQAA